MADLWPTATFVALALDHVIANMFFIPMGIWCGAPFGTGYYIWKSLIPTTLGNMIGGGFFVGTAYYYLYLTGEGGAQVTFDIGSLDTAMEAGGPMRSTKTRADSAQTVINGVEPRQLPQSGSGMMSALSKELSDDGPYAKTHKERMMMGREGNADEKV